MKRENRIEEKNKLCNDKDKKNHLQIIEVEEKVNEEEQVVGENIITENFSTIWKEAAAQIQNVKSTWNKIGPKITTPRYIVIKMSKTKENRKS